MLFTISINVFGYPMFMSDSAPLGVSDRVEEATLFNTEKGDNPELKRSYFESSIKYHTNQIGRAVITKI